MVDLVNSLYVAGSGMKAQSDRLRVVAENIANADSIGTNPNEAPYRRKVVAFKNMLDRELGIERVQVNKVGVDRSDFGLKYDPSHPAANEQGYIRTPNVNLMVEMVDMREARRGYEANIDVVEVSKNMLQQTVAMLR